MPSNSSTPVLPIVGLLIAATFWGVVWYPLRLLEQSGVHGLWSTLIIFGSAAIVGIIILYKYCAEIGREIPLFLIVAVGSAWANVAFVLAVLDGNIVRVMLLFYLSPIWATILSWWFLKERLSVRAWLTLCVAMIGAIVMLWDSEIGFPWPKDHADWLGLTSGLGFATANVAIRKLEHQSIEAKIIANWWGVAVLSGLGVVVLDLPAPDISIVFYTSMALIGMIVVTIMTASVSYGVSHMPVHRSAVILLFELVVGAVSSQWLTNEIITTIEWIGGLLIVVAAYLSAREPDTSISN